MKKLKAIIAIVEKYGITYIPNPNVWGYRFTTPNLNIENIHNCMKELETTFYFSNLTWGHYKKWSKEPQPDGEGILGYEIITTDQLEE